MIQRTQSFNSRQHMSNNTYEVFRYKDAVPKEVALHHHDFYEIYFFLSGNVQYNIESRSYLLAPGDMLLISPMELHQPVFGGEQMPYERIVLWINRQFLDSLAISEESLAACFDTTAPGHTNRLSLEGVPRQLITFQLEQMIQALESRDVYSDIYALSYLVQALVLINRMAIQAKHKEEIRSSSDSVVYSVLGYINEHYSEDLSLDFLANKFFISKYHLSREFGRLVGTSVHRYIVQKRLVIAKQMMSQGIPSTEVYQHCGFGDYSNFYRAFKGEYQISPKAYAAQLKERDPERDDRVRRIRETHEKVL